MFLTFARMSSRPARAWSAFAQRVSSIKSRIPIVNQLQVNFILLHYVYIISWAMLGSVIVYPGSDIAYIDALFFAACAATQSGLNTVDFNLLRTYQQVVLYFISMLTTPIFIHTVVVFIRLYWFEKRFQHVVRDARALRPTRSRMRTITEDKDGQDYNREEMGVGDRPIFVLRNQGDRDGEPTTKTAEEINSEAGTPADGGSDTSDDRGNDPGRELDLGFNGLRVPTQLSPEQHIAFVEKQRRNTGALRIPSPREYDRGGMPEALDDGDGNEVNRTVTHQSSERPREDNESADNVGPLDGPRITINEPDMPRTRTRGSTFTRMNTQPTVRDTTDLNETSTLGGIARRGTLTGIFRSLTQEQDRSTAPYLSWNATVGRNSNFVDLTEEQRDELGGIEYRALKTLAVVLVAYYVGFHIFGLICLVGWIMTTPTWGEVVMRYGQGRPWWGIFTAGSAFNDVGFTLTPDSMTSFQKAVWPLLLMIFLIIIGNTGFPCMLRFIIWVVSKLTPTGSALWEELKFLLDHPRRCFTLLFPKNATWWLFAILVALNAIDLIFFIILDLHDPAVTALPPGIRVLDGLFQAASTRTAGFGVVSVADLHPAMQVSYMIMMYISVFPIAISLRRTNVYEEKSLGVYPGAEEEDDDTQTAPSYIGTHLRRQLSFDLWYVFLGLFIIAIVEGGRLEDSSKYSFQLFNVLFEVVSAYGTVGMSMGYPGVNTSFAGQFQVISKLVIIAMQVRGRHRGLPYNLDRAILLPSESLHQKEMADAENRMRRRNSNLSTIPSMSIQQSFPRPEGVSTGLDTQDKMRQRSGSNTGSALNRQGTLRSQR